MPNDVSAREQYGGEREREKEWGTGRNKERERETEKERGGGRERKSERKRKRNKNLKFAENLQKHMHQFSVSVHFPAAGSAIGISSAHAKFVVIVSAAFRRLTFD